MNAPLPKSLIDNPSLDRWLAFHADGTVGVSVGKVEIGQGIATALAQIAAEELDLPLDRLVLRAGDTDAAPDEGLTTGSQSIEIGGAALRLVCAEARALFLAEAGLRLNCPPGELDVRDGAILREGAATGLSYASLAAAVSLARQATGNAPPKPRSAHRLVGTSTPRRDLPAKLAGSGFIHDMAPPGLLHARVLRQPRPGARLTALDASRIKRAEVVQDGDFVAVLAARETDARAGVLALAATWEGGVETRPEHQEAVYLTTQPADTRHWGPPAAEAGARIVRRYSKPYLSHGSMGPSCGLAQMTDGHLTVWTHSQGVYPLRAAIAAGLRFPIERISVRHAHGAGCYGHNGADDAAMDAAAIALRRPGPPIRVLWQREDEFGFAPVGTAMLVEIDAAVDGQGKPVDWTTRFWSAPHSGRGGFAASALAVRALPGAPPPPSVTESSDPTPGAGTRNVLPYYDLPAFRFEHNLIHVPPIRTSALRGLGANAHVFAIESFLDELAEAAGEDPLAYRLALLSEPRGRAVLAEAARMADWPARGPAGSGRGLGLGFGRYKNRSGMAAIVAEVEVDREVRLTRVWCAADAGLVINPDGVRAQLEGAIIQAASWSLKEQVRIDASGIASRDWLGYPILRFSEIPEIAITLMDGADNPPLGMGECAGGPTVAAIGNAVSHALGMRAREMPFTRERLASLG